MSEVEQPETEVETDGSDERGWIAATVGAKGYRADVQVRHHRLVVDEPTSAPARIPTTARRRMSICSRRSPRVRR